MLITFSGRLLASAIFAIGKADVFDAYTQCSGMCCTIARQLSELSQAMCALKHQTLPRVMPRTCSIEKWEHFPFTTILINYIYSS